MIDKVNHQPLAAVAAASRRKSLLYTHFGGFAASQTAFALFIDIVNEKSNAISGVHKS
jgi:hypothetical protein